MSYKFNKEAFKKQSKTKSSAVVDVKRTAKAEVMRFLYAVRPQVVVDIIRLQKIAISNPNEFEDFIKLYLNDKIDFDSDKFLSQIKVSNIDILRAKKNFLQ